MRLAFIISAVAVVGVFVYFGVRQYANLSPANTATINPTMTEEVQKTPEPEGERITTKDGLQVQDITFGTGAEAVQGDTLTVHYVGTLKDGTVFDASTARGEPFIFILGNGDVIQGWDLGIVGMKEGGIRELTIPSTLAYGENTVGSIPAGSELTFLVQLIQVKKP